MFTYDGPVRRLLTGIKFANRRSSLSWLADQFSGALVDYEFDVITWVPGSRGGRRRRGFDVSRYLAERAAKAAGIRARPVFRRADAVGQTSKGRTDRLRGPRLRLVGEVTGQRVLVVDDVSTTGSTLRVARELLLHGGAASVDTMVLAVTPDKSVLAAPGGVGRFGSQVGHR